MRDFDLAEISYVPTTGVRQTHETPLVAASDDTLKGYGRFVDEPESFPIEIVRWPAQGWRPIDENSGDQGGVDRGNLRILVERRDPLRPEQRRGRQLPLSPGATGRRRRPPTARQNSRQQALVWRANYHPDGGQLFYPLHGKSFVVPLALPRRRRDAGADSSPSGVTAAAGSISIRTSGTARSCPLTSMRSSWIARAASMPVFRSISQKNSAATSRRRCTDRAASGGTAHCRAAEEPARACLTRLRRAIHF